MIQNIQSPISVNFYFDHLKRKIYPTQVYYEGKNHFINKIGYHHSYRQGKTLFHIFSVASPTLFFKLKLDTDTLFWQVEQIADNEVN